MRTPACLKRLKDSVVQRIIEVKDNLDDSAVDDHFRAHQAWSKGCVECSILDTGSMVSSLGDGVLFCMRAETLVKPGAAARQTVTTRTSPFIAILGSTGSAVVSGGDDALVPDDDGARLCA